MMHATHTRLRLHNDPAGTRRTIRLPMPMADAVDRLRQIIDPAADQFETIDPDTSTYATAYRGAIALVVYGCDREAARAELARILGQLRRASR